MVKPHLEADLTDAKSYMSREQVIAHSSTMQVLKPLNFSRFRWNLLWLLLVYLVVLLPVWTRYAGGCDSAFWTTFSVFGFFDLLWFFAILWTVYYLSKIKTGMVKDWKATYEASVELDHIIVLPIYKDPMEVVFRTVDSIAAQTEAQRIVLVIAWESRTPDHEGKTRQLRERYEGQLKQIIFTVHPAGLPHEIASKAANANWGLRNAVTQLFQQGATNTTKFTVSTCDADTLFHPKYYEALMADYMHLLKTSPDTVHKTLWQAPLFYNWSLDQSSFITRITGIMRTTFMMGLLIPYNINPMSCFSFSLELGMKGGYWHPQIHMDDVGFLETMMIGTQSRIRIRALPVPVLSGPTSGETWWKDIKEWYVQIRRWGIGTADNFHYFCVKTPTLPFVAMLWFGFVYYLYYGLVLCAGGLFGVVATAYPALCPDVASGPSTPAGAVTVFGFTPTAAQVLLIMGLAQYIFFGCMYLLDMYWIRAILKIEEDISFLRNFVHFLMTAPSILMLSTVQFYSYHVIAWKGKAACTHQLAGKAQLGGQGTFGARTADLPQIGGPGAVSQPQSTAPAAGAGAGAGASAGGSSSGGAGSRSSSSDAPRASPIRVSSVPRGQLQSGDGAGLVVSSHTISVGDDEDDENDPKYQLQEPSYPSARVRTISQSSVFAEDSGSVTRRVSAARARSVSGAGARLPIGSSSERKGSSDLNQPLLDG